MFNIFAKTVFFDKLKKLWSVSEESILPFQHGDNHQAATHVINVIGYIDALTKGKDETDLTLLDRYLLYCAAILHDIDKATFDYYKKVKSKKNHGINSAIFVRGNDNKEFGFTVQESMMIASIIEHHGDKGLNDISKRIKPKHITSPVSYKEYGPVDIPKLASVFRLADMMDISHKRVSEIIVRLNFKNPSDIDSKTRARQLIEHVQVEGSQIEIYTKGLDTIEGYQSVIIAIDMLNRELREKGVVDLLNTYRYPYTFKLADNIDNKDVVEFIEKREKISKLVDDKLIIQESRGGNLFSAYNEIKNQIDLSEGELEQLKSLSYPAYSDFAKRFVKNIQERFDSSFGFSIHEQILQRHYKRDGSIDTYMKYVGIHKRKQLSIPIIFDMVEHSKLANFIEDFNAISSSLEERDDIFCIQDIIKTKDNEISFIWNHARGVKDIDNISCRVKSSGSWCMYRENYHDFYEPKDGKEFKDDEYYEDYNIELTHPICIFKIELYFPHDYCIKPICDYHYNGKDQKFKLNYDKLRNMYKFENVHNDEITVDKGPTYNFKWDLPK